ncbi:hypothetical protein CBR_g50309 [Chara braunii]|uniref:Uncharacterized protein n=1 Tax=Chara braunii TaxID=69332 RepID=A0A388K5D9_CHABU|nr:hypothetical protein CBR_g50309 [Chara braunii]|eukprot:GBG65267.1 hypothetical protein CBR_g50309 [Chara braunii]
MLAGLVGAVVLPSLVQHVFKSPFTNNSAAYAAEIFQLASFERSQVRRERGALRAAADLRTDLSRETPATAPEEGGDGGEEGDGEEGGGGEGGEGGEGGGAAVAETQTPAPTASPISETEDMNTITPVQSEGTSGVVVENINAAKDKSEAAAAAGEGEKARGEEGGGAVQAILSPSPNSEKVKGDEESSGIKSSLLLTALGATTAAALGAAWFTPRLPKSGSDVEGLSNQEMAGNAAVEDTSAKTPAIQNQSNEEAT